MLGIHIHMQLCMLCVHKIDTYKHTEMLMKKTINIILLPFRRLNLATYYSIGCSSVAVLVISRFDMSCSQAHWVGSRPIRRVMQLKPHKPTMAIGYSLRMCARHVDSTNPGRSNLVFRSKPIAEAEMANPLIILPLCASRRGVVQCPL